MGEAPYVGAYCIRPTNGPGRGQVRRKRSREETPYVGRKSIRPTNGPDRGQTRVGGFLLFFYQEKKRRQKKIKASAEAREDGADVPDWVGVPDIPCQYPANLAGVPDGPCRGWEKWPGTPHRHIPYPVNLAGVPDALIFFCLLFFHQGKKRRKGSRGAAPFVGAYCIRPTDDPRGSND